MKKPEEVNRGARPASKRVRAKALLTRKRLQTAKTLTQVAFKVAALRAQRCKVCGQRLHRAAEFCAGCGAARTAEAPARPATTNSIKKPNVVRRILALGIDRMLTLPFFFMPSSKWLWLALALQLLCDGFTGRGPGKWICRLRVADAKSYSICTGLRPMLRRAGAALALAAYARWETAPIALGYDLISFLFVWHDRAGQRLEDKLLRTRVLGESVFHKMTRECGACGAFIPARARFCPKCGKSSKQAKR